MAKPVICLGECLVDRLFHGMGAGSSSLANWTDYPGGAPANVATALVKLGTCASFIGCLGKDTLGDWLLKTLETQDVHCLVQRHDIAATRTVLVRRNQQGERQFVGFSAPDTTSFADACLQADGLDDAEFDGAAYLVMGTLGLAYGETAEAMARASELAYRHGLIQVVDLNWRPVFWPNVAIAPQRILPFLDSVDLLKVAADEARWLFGTANAAVIRQRLPRCRLVLVTDGSRGCAYAADFSQGHVPAFTVDSEDTTGAGDAFLAAVIHQLYQKGWETALNQPEQLLDILRYASAVGALTTLRPGAMAAQPQAQEVSAFLFLNSSSADVFYGPRD